MSEPIDDRDLVGELSRVFRDDVRRANLDLERGRRTVAARRPRVLGLTTVLVVTAIAVALMVRGPSGPSSSAAGAPSPSSDGISSATPTPVSATGGPTPVVVDGMPGEFGGQPVLHGDAALEVFKSASAGNELMVGGWLSGDEVLSCPDLHAGEWWNPCLAVALRETAAAGPQIFIYRGPIPVDTPSVGSGQTRPVIFAVHTHDRSCPADNADCASLPVIDAVAWSGSTQPVSTSFGPAPSSGLSPSDAVSAAAAGARTMTTAALTLVGATAGPYGTVGPGGSDVRADRWVWAIVFSGDLQRPGCVGPGCAAPSTLLVVIDYMTGAVLIAESPA